MDMTLDDSQIDLVICYRITEDLGDFLRLNCVLH